jgi:hypothetical protein
MKEEAVSAGEITGIARVIAGDQTFDGGRRAAGGPRRLEVLPRAGSRLWIFYRAAPANGGNFTIVRRYKDRRADPRERRENR